MEPVAVAAGAWAVAPPTGEQLEDRLALWARLDTGVKLQALVSLVPMKRATRQQMRPQIERLLAQAVGSGEPPFVRHAAALISGVALASSDGGGDDAGRAELGPHADALREVLRAGDAASVLGALPPPAHLQFGAGVLTTAGHGHFALDAAYVERRRSAKRARRAELSVAHAAEAAKPAAAKTDYTRRTMLSSSASKGKGSGMFAPSGSRAGGGAKVRRQPKAQGTMAMVGIAGEQHKLMELKRAAAQSEREKAAKKRQAEQRKVERLERQKKKLKTEHSAAPTAIEASAGAALDGNAVSLLAQANAGAEFDELEVDDDEQPQNNGPSSPTTLPPPGGAGPSSPTTLPPPGGPSSPTAPPRMDDSSSDDDIESAF